MVVRYILQKLGFYLVAFWAALTVNFFLPRLMPGNPVDMMLTKLAQRGPVSPEAREAIELLLGTNSEAPLPVQYLEYLGKIFSLDLGVSVAYFPAW